MLRVPRIRLGAAPGKQWREVRCCEQWRAEELKGLSQVLWRVPGMWCPRLERRPLVSREGYWRLRQGLLMGRVVQRGALLVRGLALLEASLPTAGLGVVTVEGSWL